MKSEKYLPIGTVVLLQDGEKKLMITGFCPINTATEESYDYCGCLYPEGSLVVDNIFLFNHDQIDEIIYLGYDNEEEREFKKELKEAVEKENE